MAFIKTTMDVAQVDIPTMTLEESKRVSSATTISVTKDKKYFVIVESEGTQDPIINTWGAPNTQVIAVSKSSSSTSRSIFGWTFIAQTSGTYNVNGNGWANIYVFTYS